MLSLTCNNFYKSMWNKKDILKDKTNIEEKNETFFQTGLNYEKKKKRILPNELNFRSSVRKSETNKNPFFDFSNVDGIGLLKNPFEPNRKAKKEKIWYINDIIRILYDVIHVYMDDTSMPLLRPAKLQAQ